MRDMPACSNLPSRRLQDLGLTLPPVRAPVGCYSLARIMGDLLYLSGQIPTTADGTRMTGKVGETVTLEQAREHAKLATLNLLSAAHAELGTIDRIDRIVMVTGYVNATHEFGDHPEVINACSELLVKIFGDDRGSHARAAIGVGSLPRNATVEIELVAAFII